MTPLEKVEGRAIPLGLKNVDTDVIIPAHWLKTTSREGMGRGAFESLRADPDNLFDRPENRGAPILIAGDNFGCGSSREHAAWALGDLGIRVVIAPSYSDIFSGNAVKNGILPVVLPQAAVDRLIEVAATDPIHVDLDTQTVTTPFQLSLIHICLNPPSSLRHRRKPGEAIRRGLRRLWIAASPSAHRNEGCLLYTSRCV